MGWLDDPMDCRYERMEGKWAMRCLAAVAVPFVFCMGALMWSTWQLETQDSKTQDTRREKRKQEEARPVEPVGLEEDAEGSSVGGIGGVEGWQERR